MNQQQYRGCIPSLGRSFIEMGKNAPLMALLILIAGTITFYGFRGIITTPPKTYIVSHTPTEWQSELDTLAMVQRSIGYALNRQESDQFQAAIARMQQRIIDQVKPQILADTVKPPKR
jgi:hypothetical protein